METRSSSISMCEQDGSGREIGRGRSLLAAAIRAERAVAPDRRRSCWFRGSAAPQWRRQMSSSVPAGAVKSPEVQTIGRPTCPWCAQEFQVPIPNIDPPPESVQVTKPALLESTWLSRLVETDRCPACQRDIKLWWYGGQKW
jgi:hypothetical protein